uniref:Ubiquitin-like protease family profile domain-containing protein n=1 Tax=Panagrolaimus sp. ES5 TaxID=591445 RepID=A0AC34FXF7_9BILA
MMMDRCTTSTGYSSTSFMDFKSRKRHYDDSSMLPMKKFCEAPVDYMDSIDADDSQGERMSFSSDRTTSSESTSSSSHDHKQRTSGIRDKDSFEFIESDISETEWSTSESSIGTEHEEDAYADEEFFAIEPESEDELSSDDENGVFMFNYHALTVMDATTEMVRIRFPYTSLRIKVSDFMCLSEGDHLNDTLVDFYLNHLVSNVIDEDSYRVHLFASMFWHRLRLNVFRADKTLSRQERLHSQFRHSRKYMSQIGFFDNDFAIFPINELDHWSLAIVCNLESVIPDDYIIEGLTDDGQPLPRHDPCIVIFDPFGSDDTEHKKNLVKYGTIIRELIEYEYTHTIGKGQDCSSKFSDKTFPIIFPRNLPKQQNFCDSGIHILEYATNFLTSPPSLAVMASKGFNFKENYPKFTTKRKRAELQNVILSLCKDKEKWMSICDYHP